MNWPRVKLIIFVAAISASLMLYLGAGQPAPPRANAGSIYETAYVVANWPSVSFFVAWELILHILFAMLGIPSRVDLLLAVPVAIALQQIVILSFLQKLAGRLMRKRRPGSSDRR